LARRATLVDRAKIEAAAVVQVDSGDLLPAPGDDATLDAQDALERRARLVFASYRRMGVDAVTLGERELAFEPKRLRAMLSAANLVGVTANLVDKNGELAFPSDKLIDAEGRSVGVFGVIDMPAETLSALTKWGLTVTDPIEAARAATQSLRVRGASFVVGLFHVAGGVARAREILKEVSDIDVVVLGHGAEGLVPGAPALEGRTRIVSAGALGTAVGRLDVRSLRDGNGPTFDDQVLPLKGSIPNHLGVELLAQVDTGQITGLDGNADANKNGPAKGAKVYENWDYASNTACEFCHQPALAQWKTTDHAQAFATLKKKKHDRDPSCLGCHMTGFLQPGGTRSIATAAEQFSDVGCESCHGPSTAHVRSNNKKKGTSRKVAATVCLGCHTHDQNFGPFDYAAAVKAILGPGHGALAL
jgi:hypothetical protein